MFFFNSVRVSEVCSEAVPDDHDPGTPPPPPPTPNLKSRQNYICTYKILVYTGFGGSF